MSRNLLLLAGAAGALAGLFVSRRRRTTSGAATAPDPRAEELRRKLAQARETAVDEADFEAAGMGAETIVEEESPAPTPAPLEDVDEARRRVHEQARASAEEMRRSGGGPEEA